MNKFFKLLFFENIIIFRKVDSNYDIIVIEWGEEMGGGMGFSLMKGMS